MATDLCSATAGRGAVKVLDLRCGNEHRFEGWFGSDADFESQLVRRLVACPLCGSADVLRMPSAPRLNRARTGEPAAGKAGTPAVDPARAQAQVQWLQAMRKVVAESEDVGDRFAREARRIHHGEAEARNILGRASGEEVASLREEGIEVVQVVVPESLKGPVH